MVAGGMLRKDEMHHWLLSTGTNFFLQKFSTFGETKPAAAGATRGGEAFLAPSVATAAAPSEHGGAPSLRAANPCA
jgi:hypothetical protein